jgi:hypothetical protein
MIAKLERLCARSSRNPDENPVATLREIWLDGRPVTDLAERPPDQGSDRLARGFATVAGLTLPTGTWRSSWDELIELAGNEEKGVTSCSIGSRPVPVASSVPRWPSRGCSRSS